MPFIILILICALAWIPGLVALILKRPPWLYFHWGWKTDALVSLLQAA